jgi:hypothetical protein
LFSDVCAHFLHWRELWRKSDVLSFIFGLILPEPYAPEVKSPCQQALEDVMQTFQVVTN